MEAILIVDDEKNYLLVLEDLLSEEGYEVITAESAGEGLALAESHELDVVLTDMKMPGMDGMAFMERLHAIRPDMPVVMMTAFGTVEKAVEAMRKGAFDYILKPFENEELRVTIRKAVDHCHLVRKNRYLTRELQDRYQFSNIVGKNAAMRLIYELIEKVAPSKATVLISGESGTGKELIARAIHFNSPRKDASFISVNCGALPETLLESELFGHEKGAFSGAVNQRKGRFELAHGGTLFLDEITEMSPPLQVKLLRVLQEMEFERVGGAQTIKVDVRMVAASNRDLKCEVAAGRFRSDLFYRLNVVRIHLPPLRERPDDVVLLINHFLRKHSEGNAGAGLTVDPEALRYLLDYQWPGNVRELENVIERAVILSNGDRIAVKDLPSELRDAQEQRLPGGMEHGHGDFAPLPGGSEPPRPRNWHAGDPGERPPSGQKQPKPRQSRAQDFIQAHATEYSDLLTREDRQSRALEFIYAHAFITNKYYSQLNDVSERQALRELSEMVEVGVLARVGKGRACRYVASEETTGGDDNLSPS
jgi:two-component system NtrC family response regulator